MINNFLKILKNLELRNRIFYTLLLLAVYRIGIFITIPGIDRMMMKNHLHSMHGDNGVLSFFNFFSGGALENASIFALGIMPYITSSIIMSLLTVMIPFFEKKQKEGEDGRRKISKYTRYGTVLISIIQGIMMANYFRYQSYDGNSIINKDWIFLFGEFSFILMTVLTLTTGTVFIMWIGEKITELGIGNGISLIIFAGIVARLPSASYSTFIGIKNNTYKFSEILILIIVMFIVLSGIVFIERGQRRIPVQYTKRLAGNKEYDGQKTYLPLKINTAGVIPPIFASTILMFPSTISSFIKINWICKLQELLSIGSWQYQIVFVLMIIFFSYFYTAIQFNPVDVADNLRKFGGFIPSVRPGQITSNYIDYIITRLTFSGALYLSFISILPMIIQKTVSNQVPFYFGGTGLLIVVSVALDTVQQIDGYFIDNGYENIYKPKNINIKARILMDK